MIRRPALAPAVALLTLLAACGGSDDTPTPTPHHHGAEATPTDEPVIIPADAPTWHRDVAPIMQAQCSSCHLPGGSAPFVLETYEQVKAMAPLVANAVAERRMPPWGLDGSGACNTYVNGRWMPDSDIATLVEWASGYQALGEEADAPEPIVIEPVKLESVGATVDLGVEYAPDQRLTDDYRCFIVDANLARDSYLTGFEVHPGNPRIVHHVILYDVMTDEGVAIAQAYDEAEPGPGYTCFGTPRTPVANVLAAWAPGTPAQIYPEGTGLRMSSDRKLVVQMHYNMLASEPGDTDRTTLDLQIEDRVPSPAAMMFVGDFDLVLPAGDAKAWTFWEGSMAEMGLPMETSVYGIFPHQHTLGTQLQVDFLKGDEAHCFSRVSDWDFNWQQTNFFTRPVQIGPDDRMRISCGYNTLQRDTIVPWGDGTQDEMCLALLYLTFDVADDAVRPDTVGERVQLDNGDRTSFGGPLDIGWSTSFGGRSVTAPTAVRLTADGGSVMSIDTENAALRLDGELLSLPGEGDGLLMARDASGALSWHQVIGGEGDDGIASMDLDADGNIFVVGWMESDLTIGDDTLSFGGERDVFVARFAPDGTPVWARGFGGAGYAYPRKIAVGPDGSVAVGLYFYDDIVVAGETLTTASGGSAGLVVWLSPDGEVRMVDACQSEGHCRVRAVGFTDGGDLLAGGRFSAAATLAGESRVSKGSWDGFLMHYTAAGAKKLVSTFGDKAWDYIDDIEADGAGGVFLTGRFGGSINIDGQGATFNGGSDAFVAHLGGDLKAQWVRSVGGVAGDYGTDLVADGSGGVWATIGREGPVDAGGGPLIRAGGTDIALVHFGGDGAHVSSHHFGGIAGDYNAYFDRRGDALLLGWTAYGDVEIGGRSVGGGSGGEAIVLKLGM